MLTRTRLLSIILVACVLIGLAYFGSGYAKERQEQKALITKMNDTNKILSLIPSQPDDLQQQLANAQQANQAARNNILPSQIDTTQVIKNILTTADVSNVKVVPLITDKWTTKKIDNVEYLALPISLSVDGNFTNITAFINRLYGNEFTSLSVDTLSLNKTTGSAGDITGTIELEIIIQPVK